MRWLVPVLVLAALCWWFGIEPLARALTHASAGWLIAYLVLTAVVIVGTALRWRMLAAPVGGTAPLARLVGARLAGDAVGSMVPSGRLAGEPLRVALARGAGMSTAQSTAGVAVDRMVEVTGNMVAVLVYVALLCFLRGAAQTGRAPIALAASMGVLLIALAALVVRLRLGQRPLALLYGVRARRVAPRLSSWMDGLRQVEDHLLDFFHRQPRLFVLGVLVSMAIEALTVVQYHALLTAFGVRLDLLTLVMVLIGSGVARAAPTPAALGALEAVQVAVVGATTGHPELGFAVGLIVRLHETLLLGLGLAVLSHQGVSLAQLRLAQPRAGA